MGDLIKNAKRYATQVHPRLDGLKKATKRPYDVHLKAVASIVGEVTKDEEMIAAAWLHESVDKTAATHRDLEKEFGLGVARLVRELTPVSRPSDGNANQRAAIDREYIASASARAKSIKLADLIDTLQDACKNNALYAKELLTDVSPFLEVLRDGDPGLYRRTDRTISRCCERLGIPQPAATQARLELESPAQQAVFGKERMQRLFAEAFSARDIAESLRSFDADRPATEAAAAMDALGLGMVGVREGGMLSGFVWRKDLREGRCGDVIRRFGRDQVVQDDSSLSEVILVLSRYEYCFVQILDTVVGVIRKGDIEKPVVRMWLFGMITILEINLSSLIQQRWPGDDWFELCPPKRLAKARELQAERERIDQRSTLIDCLQLSDKASILLKDPEVRAEFGFTSKGQADRIVRDIESLRNNLAHGQQIVAHDWPQIIRMTRRLRNAGR